MTILLKKKR